MTTTKVRYNQIKTGLPAGGDVNYNNVSLLLNMEGSNGSTTFADGSSSGHSVTANGNASISTSEFKFGSSSAYFDGNGDYLSMSTTNSLDLRSGDFTIETWFYDAGISNDNTIIGNWGQNLDDNYILGVNNPHQILFYWGGNGNVNALITSSSTYSTNTWNHVAVVRNGNTFTLYLNGVSVGSETSTDSTYQDSSTLIGKYGSNLGGFSANTFYGYIDQVRITKGVARYTSNFSVPTAAFPAFESKEGKKMVVGSNGNIDLQ